MKRINKAEAKKLLKQGIKLKRTKHNWYAFDNRIPDWYNGSIKLPTNK